MLPRESTLSFGEETHGKAVVDELTSGQQFSSNQEMPLYTVSDTSNDARGNQHKNKGSAQTESHRLSKSSEGSFRLPSD